MFQRGSHLWSQPANSPHERARAHFDRAVALSAGRLAAPYVALAEAVTIQKQDRREFDDLHGRAASPRVMKAQLAFTKMI